MPRQPRILAVGHDAFRAGAQIVFLHIVRWLREHHDSDLSVALAGGGDLLGDYEAVAPTSVLVSRVPPTSSSRAIGAIRRNRHRLQLREQRWAPGSLDLVYANSLAVAEAAAEIADEAGCPAICHVHELEMSLRRTISPERFRALTPRFERFIAVSEAVRQNLVEAHGIDPSRIDLVHEGVPRPAADRGDSALPAALRSVPDDAFVVGGCGTADWRKGIDAFVLTARASERRSDAPMHFVWVGGETGALDQYRQDVRQLGIDDVVHFVGAQADPGPFFDRFDAFFLSSREDPFPLVALEAAALGIPIVCFADGGGMPEFVEDDAGHVVPYLDIDEASAAIGRLAASSEHRAALGRRAAEKFEERCSIDVIGPQVAAVIDRSLAGARA